jgi:substrate import-associated zinc metallohydrolase lipoprotein
MKKKLQYRLVLISTIVLLVACKKSETLNTDITGLGGETWQPTSIDKWISDSLTASYNIDVKYRWDAFELALDKTLVPPFQENVVPMLRIVKYGWIDAYEQLAGTAFVRTLCPKQYYLVGSVAYNPNGTITLGEAENGRKITLYRVNQLKVKDTVFVKRVLKTIQHEFGHILQHSFDTPTEFKLVSGGSYTAGWSTVTDADARVAGFITPYAMSEPDEDFVEMIAVMLTEGKGGYETILKGLAAAPQAVLLLRQKEQIIVDYYRRYYSIDFYALQTVARQKLLQLTQ